MAASAQGPELEEAAITPSPRDARALIDAARLGATAFGRPDLAEVMTTALARIDRATTLVGVIGDYKQGKSSLVNALLGMDAAVVDDDIATAVPTVFRYGPAWTATIWEHERAKPDGSSPEPDSNVRRELAVDEYRVIVTGTRAESGAAVSVTVPSPLLEGGLMLLDSPAAGGLSTSATGVVLGYLRSMDGLVYVADASAPLDRPRLDLLRRAVEACPAVLVVRTKTDLYAEWRRIIDIDTATLSLEGVEVPVVAVSSALMHHAAKAGSHELAAESGIPALRELLESVVMDESRGDAIARAVDEARFVLKQLLSSARDELAVLDDPSATAARQAELERTRERLAHLRGPGARWSQLLGDRFTDATGDADYRFRASMRDIARELDERIEKIDPARDWTEFATWLQDAAGAASTRLLTDVAEAAVNGEAAVREVLREESGSLLVLLDSVPTLVVDTDRLTNAKGIERPGAKTHAGLMFSALRGGQSGFFSLSFLAGIAGITLSGVAAAGVGLVFAGRQVIDERRRQLQARRQQARAAARRYLDDVEFVAAKESRDLARDLLRRLREHFLAQFGQLQQTCAESLATIEQTISRDEQNRTHRRAKLRDRIVSLEHLLAVASSGDEPA